MVGHLSEVPCRLCHPLHGAEVGVDRNGLEAGFLQVRNEFHHIVIAHEVPVTMLVVGVLEPLGHLIELGANGADGGLRAERGEILIGCVFRTDVI